jgi:hypothetical protein
MEREDETTIEELSAEELAALDAYAQGWDAAVETAHWRETAKNTLPVVVGSLIAIVALLLSGGLPW